MDPSPSRQKTLAGPLPALKDYLHLDPQGIDIGSLYAAFLGFLPADPVTTIRPEEAAAAAVSAAANGETRIVRQGTVTDASGSPLGRKGLPKLNMGGSSSELNASGTTPSASPSKTQEVGKKGLPKLDIGTGASSTPATTTTTGGADAPVSPRSRMGLPKLDLSGAASAPSPEAQGQPTSAGKKGLPKLDMSATQSPTSDGSVSPRGSSKMKLPKLDLAGSGASLVTDAAAAAAATSPATNPQDDGRTHGGATPRPHLDTGRGGSSSTETSPKDYTRAPTPRPHLSGPESPEGTRKPTPRPSWVPKLQLSASDV